LDREKRPRSGDRGHDRKLYNSGRGIEACGLQISKVCASPPMDSVTRGAIRGTGVESGDRFG